MATERWVGGTGVGLTWTAAVGTEVTTTAIANGNAVLSSVVFNNGGANLDVFADVSISLASMTVGAGAPFVGIYLYPLNEDGTSYGDGRFTTVAVGIPPSQYFVGAIQAPSAAVGVVTGMIRGILIPPGTFKFVFYNQLLATMAATGNVVDVRTYDRQVS